MKPSRKWCFVQLIYATNLCKATSHSTDHFVTRDAKLWVARSKSNLAMRAANKIFIKILLATGWSFPGFSSSLKVGLAMPASVNGVGTSFKDEGLTFASLQ